jgi:hypothetical protein
MEQIARLPQPLRQIEIPGWFSVTSLSAAGPCLLRAVSPASGIAGAASGPRAEFGRLAHRLMELAASKRLGADGVPSRVEDAFEYLLGLTASRLAADGATQRYADLSVGFTKREWEKRRYLAIVGAAALTKGNNSYSLRPSPLVHKEPLTLSRFLRSDLLTASEVPFESAIHRIRGRLDLVSRAPPDHITITDFKSGSVTNSNGEIRDQTSRQLLLYALAADELAPLGRISLRVMSPDGEWTVPWNKESKEEILDWLKNKTDRLPVGGHFAAEELALVGPQCAHCELRPVCPTYRNSIAASWGTASNLTELPLDTAGSVRLREIDKDGFISLTLLDLAQRVVKVHRLRPRAGFELTPKAEQVLWLFDLASIEARLQKAGWRQPRNFHEVAATPTERTAWTLRIYLG